MSRQDRVSEALRREIGLIIHDELKDPRLGFITITRVELTQDLRCAKVFFSVLGKEDDYKKSKEALDCALGFIRRLVAQRVSLRFAPEISFQEDRSIEYAVRIEEVLNEIEKLNMSKKPNRKELNKHISSKDGGVGVRIRKEALGKLRPSSVSGEAKITIKNRKEVRGEPKKRNRLRKK